MKYKGMLKIYLAGKMSGLTFNEMNNWRKKLKLEILREAGIAGCQVEVVNPIVFYNFEEKKYQSEKEVEDYDLAHVISSDVIVVNLEGLKSSDGTKIELHDANYHERIPVVAFGDKGLYENLHPWVKRDITRVEENIQGVTKYLREFYMV